MARGLFLLFLVLGLVVGPPPALAAPLHEAAKSGAVEEVARLVQAGADLEALDEDGETPLTAAALAGRTAVVRFLVDRGANIKGRNEGGFTALHAAAYNGHIRIVELALERGADIDDQENKAKVAPLHAAAERNHLDVAGLLVERGARIDLEELNGWTPLARATFKRYAQMVTFLRRHGAQCPSESAVGAGHNGFCRDPGG